MGTIVKVGRFVWKVVDVRLILLEVLYSWELSTGPKDPLAADMAMDSLKVWFPCFKLSRR